MSDILARITAYKRAEIAAAKAAQPLEQMMRQAETAPRPRGFAAAIAAHAQKNKAAVIAEIKKASPSKGVIRADFDPAAHARAYAKGGAACLSVLTDTPSFQGTKDDLRAAHAACALPILRKDFLYEPYQVVEARAWGADAVLIILTALDDAAAATLLKAARDWGMDALVEVHDAAEMARAKTLGATLIGINNRNLKTFETTLATTRALAAAAPKSAQLISESGISSAADIADLRRYHVAGFLVGESLMRAPDPEIALATLLA